MLLSIKIYTFILLSLYFKDLLTQQNQPFSITINCAQPPITLNNIMESQPQTTVTPTQITKQLNTQELEQKTIEINNFQNPLHHIPLLTNNILDYCLNRKCLIFTGIILCSIVSFLYYYYSMATYLNDEKNWVAWHNGSLESLLESNTEPVIEKILKEIQIRYYNWQTPIDPIHGLIKFSMAIDKEIIVLKRYISILNCAKKLYFNCIFSIEKNLQETQKKLSFIIFLKKQFLEWISQHNTKALNFNTIYDANGTKNI